MGTVGIRASLVVLIAGVATLVAHFEHKARIDLESELIQQSPVQSPPLEMIELQTVALRSNLTPNPFLLDLVKEQTIQKPLFDRKSSAYEKMIEDAARLHRVSPALVKAVIQAESKFNPQAVSSQGAVGLMQILPSTARSMGVSSPLLEPYNNITAGVRYLKLLLKQFDNDESLALAAYNCGPDAVNRYGGKVPPFSETRSFVSQVMKYYQSHIDS